METLPLKKIIQMVNGTLVSGNIEKTVDRVSTDSRAIKPGELFIPIKGENFDGHDYISQAIEKGAGVIFVETNKINLQNVSSDVAVVSVDNTVTALGRLAAEYRKQFNIPVVAITGSSGKTTVKEMIAAILNSYGPALAPPKSWNNQIGVPSTILELTNQHKFCVVELGTNHFGEIEHLSKICLPTVGVITNIGKAHLESFGDLKGVLKEKMSLFDNMTQPGKAVINLDDSNLAGYQLPLKISRITYSLRNKSADVWTTKIKEFEKGIEVTVNAGHNSYDIFLPLIGIFNVYNVLAATACVYGLGIDVELVVKSLKTFVGPSMRMEKVQVGKGIILINDAYNANPSSMRESIITFLKLYPDKKKIMVLGDMLELGLNSANEHYELGKFIANFPLKYLFLYGPEMKNLHWGIKDKNKKSDNVFHFLDKNELMKKLIKSVDKNMVILLKGSRKNKLEEIVEKMKEGVK